jgi:tetratricopeptide (TPR) repeat protein
MSSRRRAAQEQPGSGLSLGGHASVPGGNHVAGSPINALQAGTITGNVIFNEGAKPRTVPWQVPTRVDGFVGRDHDLDRLGSLCRADHDDNASFVVLSGGPGIGKTALAVEWVRQNRHLFPDGCLFADMHGFDLARPVTTAEVLDRFLRSFEVAPGAMPNNIYGQAALLRDLTAGRRMVTILDNVGEAEQARPIIAAIDSLVLVTSRNLLLGLSATHGARRLPVEPLEAQQCLDLLCHIVGREKIDAELTAAERLVLMCAGVPLAVRIAAERVRTRPHLMIADHVEGLESEGQLDSLSIEGDGRAELRTVFSWSYQSLTVEAASLFRLLGLYPGRDFGVGVPLTLCPQNLNRVRRSLQELVGASLLVETGRDRYKFHDLLRAYSAELVRNNEEMNVQESAARRLIDWYVSTAENADQLISPGKASRIESLKSRREGQTFDSHADAVRWMEQERSNIIDVIRMAIEIGDFESAALMPNLLWGYYNLSKHWSDWEECNEIGLEASRLAGDKISEAYLLTSQGVAYRNLRETAKAIACHMRAIEIFQETGSDPVGLGYATQNLANAHSDIKQFDVALPYFQEAAATFRATAGPGARRGLAVTLNSLAIALNAMGDPSHAINHARNALKISTEIHDDHSRAFALEAVGTAHAQIGDFEVAVEHLMTAVALREQVKDRYGKGRALIALGQIYFDNGELRRAADVWRDSLQLLSDVGAPEQADVLMKLNNLADTT